MSHRKVYRGSTTQPVLGDVYPLSTIFFVLPNGISFIYLVKVTKMHYTNCQKVQVIVSEKKKSRILVYKYLIVCAAERQEKLKFNVNVFLNSI